MNGFSFLIRISTLKDLPDISRLNQDLFVSDGRFDNTLNLGWPLSAQGQEYFRSRAAGTDNGVAFIAEAQGKVIGYLCGSIKKTYSYRTIEQIAELDNMLVAAEHRSCGIGTALIKSFREWCTSKSVNRVKVEATAQNVEAIKFYRRNGFRDYSLCLEQEV